MTSFRVCIPWRDSGDPCRRRNFNFVKEWWENVFQVDPRVIDSDPAQPFNRAAARNACVRDWDEVTVICDADTIPMEPGPVWAAIDEAHKDSRLHLPYTDFFGLTKKATKRVLERKHVSLLPNSDDVQLFTQWSTGGLIVIHSDAYNRVKHDERFIGWGFEDTAFRCASDAILGPAVKHYGSIIHLWHKSAIDMQSEEYRRNQELARRYDDAEGDRDAILKVMRSFP